MRNKIISFCKRWVLVIAISGGFCLNFIYWTRGDLVSLLLGVGIAIWDTFLLAIAALVANTFGARRFAQLCIVAINMIVLGLFASIVVGYGIYVQDMNAVKLYREPLVLSLETYKNQHGRYPDKLSTVTNLYGGKPHLIEDTMLYYNTGDRFLLSFFDPDPTIRFWVYDSAKKQWRITN